ncbi:hypothetical protein DV515_00011883 [Chloebia gouldiae]|uniref:Uncharacterized protein n=1 Tax=Chloebia gouldiae TaxID=44316 RepID=A0A3L8S6B4_CHLGU|nr:hypothetical protein DV515_00011883 [Chloebia gouldiae]
MRGGIVIVAGERAKSTASELLTAPFTAPSPLWRITEHMLRGSYKWIGYNNVMDTTSSLHSFGLLLVLYLLWGNRIMPNQTGWELAWHLAPVLPCGLLLMTWSQRYVHYRAKSVKDKGWKNGIMAVGRIWH